MMADLVDERLRPPLWQSAARVMAGCFRRGARCRDRFTGRPDRVPVLTVGFVISATLYLVIGLFGGSACDDLRHADLQVRC
jgi:hypothetical protein